MGYSWSKTFFLHLRHYERRQYTYTFRHQYYRSFFCSITTIRPFFILRVPVILILDTSHFACLINEIIGRIDYVWYNHLSATVFTATFRRMRFLFVLLSLPRSSSTSLLLLLFFSSIPIRPSFLFSRLTTTPCVVRCLLTSASVPDPPHSIHSFHVHCRSLYAVLLASLHHFKHCECFISFTSVTTSTNPGFSFQNVVLLYVGFRPTICFKSVYRFHMPNPTLLFTSLFPMHVVLSVHLWIL